MKSVPMPTTEQRQIALLEKQLNDERKKRKKAEEILHSRTLDLFHANQYLSNMTDRLRYVIWESHEAVWEYLTTEDEYYLYKDISPKASTVKKHGTFNSFVDAVHEDDRVEFVEKWQNHINGSSEYIETRVRSFSELHNCYRWIYIRGKKTVNESTRKIEKVAGMIKDIHDNYLTELSYIAVAETFVKSKNPGFIIDFSTNHITITKSFAQLVKSNEEVICQSELIELLPIDIIKTNQKNDVVTFKADLLLCDASKINCEFILHELLQTSDNNEFRFVVGFIKPI